MRKSSTVNCALCVAVALLADWSLQAQKPEATLSVQTASGQTSFHVGERIPLKLTFASSNDTGYRVAPANGPRKTEFDFEHIEVTPSTGWSDPLATYFAQEFLRTGHGWPWPPLLKAKPVEVSIDLNQWVRFDESGTYRIKVINSRVHPVAGVRGATIALESNAMALEIVPATADWESAKLKSIVADWNTTNASWEAAAADLRYLATPDGIDEMTSRLREIGYFTASACSMGLMGLPDSMRETAISSMKKRIEEPDFPISPVFFSTMSFLYVIPGSKADSIRQQREAIDPALWQTVFASIPKKEPSARAQTAQTLLDFGRNIKTPGVHSQMASLLRASFLNLDATSQEDDLREHWDMLRSPEILPALKVLTKLPSANLGAICPCASEVLKSIAFRRWYELDPEGARIAILAQIGSTTPSMSGQVLKFLPPESLPQFESMWADAYLRTTSQLQEINLGSLLVRFGSGRATAQMIAKLNETPRPNTCWSHSFAIAYLVRFSPEEARPLLRREMGRDRARPVCDGDLLRLLAENGIDAVMTAPVLNEIAVEALDDANPANVLDAIRYLTAYGATRDEKPIWDHYVTWTDAWQGKEYLLDHPRTRPSENQSSQMVGEELGIALLWNQGWVADQGLISRVLERCVGQQMCSRLKDEARSAVPPYQVIPADTSDGAGVTRSCNVAQYRTMSLDLLDAKIKQYPHGSKFILWSWWPATYDQQRLEDEVRAIFKKNDMSLEKDEQ